MTLMTSHNAPQIDRNVEREVIVHSLLRHPNIVGFKRIFLTSTHLGIAMEYATGGELFNKVKASGRFDEDTARFFFQQLVQGVQYCHQNGVAHRGALASRAACRGRTSDVARARGRIAPGGRHQAGAWPCTRVLVLLPGPARGAVCGGASATLERRAGRRSEAGEHAG